MLQVFLFIFIAVTSFAARADYAEAPVRDAGSISGKILYNGRAPHPRSINVVRDATACGATRIEDAWSVAADGAVENVVVYLMDIKKGKKMDAPLHPMLDQKQCRYLPHVQVVGQHALLQIKSSDPVLHNVHSFLDGSTVINFSVPPGNRALVKKLDKIGGMQLKCDIHSFMRGGIFVAENPYYAVTREDGTYAIKDVPPGTYTIATWHEEGGPLSESVTVGPNQTLTWNGRVR
jgi:hypothetical protein